MIEKGKVVIISLLLLFSLLPLVSAQFGGLPPVRTLMEDVVRALTDIAEPVFLPLFGQYSSDEFLFAKILLFVLLMVIIRFIVTKVPMFEENKTVAFILSLVLSILAVRFISENQLTQGIILPAGVLGVVLATILPFMIFFFFVHKNDMSSVGRKLSWIFFGIVFLVLWLTRTDLPSVINQIYGWTSVAVILVFIFDSKIHEYFGIWQVKKDVQEIDVARLGDAINKYHYYSDLYGKTGDQRFKKAAEASAKRAHELGYKV